MEPIDATWAKANRGFAPYRKRVLTFISTTTVPAGTVFQTPEGLKAEDEECRIAFDIQGGIYPIRESVFLASYEELPIDWTHPTLGEASMIP